MGPSPSTTTGRSWNACYDRCIVSTPVAALLWTSIRPQKIIPRAFSRTLLFHIGRSRSNMARMAFRKSFPIDGTGENHPVAYRSCRTLCEDRVKKQIMELDLNRHIYDFPFRSLNKHRTYSIAQSRQNVTPCQIAASLIALPAEQERGEWCVGWQLLFQQTS